MKRTSHKSLSSLLALTLALSMVFAGCSSKSSADKNTAAGGNMAYDTAAKEEMGIVYDDMKVEAPAEAPAAPAPVPEADEELEEAAAKGIDPPQAPASDPLAGKNIKLIWRAEVNVETLEFDKFTEQLNQSVAEFGGFVESSSLYGGSSLSGYNSRRNGFYTIRIPADKLDSFLSQVGTLANVTSQNKYSENITLEYADTEARKATLKLEEEKMMELLAKATELSDIIQLEARLSDIHYQLDAYSSTLRRYDNLVDYSTINLYVDEVQKITDVKAATMGERIVSGFQDSLYGLRVFGEDLIVFLIARSPILLVWAIVIALVILIIRKLVRRSYKKAPKKSKLAPPTYNSPAIPVQKSENSDEKKNEK